MDYFSSAPDLIIHSVIGFLTEPEIAKISAVSNLFLSKSIFHFRQICSAYHIETNSPISAYGTIYHNRVKIIENWNSESPSTQFLHYNLVKSVKFGSDFFVLLRYDGSVYSNISGQLELLDSNVSQIDACMQGFIIQKWNNEVIWVRKNIGGLVFKTWEGETPTAIAASVYGVLGFDNGKVIVFDRDYQREVSFPNPNSSKIIDIRSTPKILLILTETNTLYVCGLITLDAIQMIQANVRFCSIGNSHSFAVIQESVKPFESWDSVQLNQYMQKNGFEDCCQLIKNHEIDGKDIESLTDKYLIETLGIRENDRRVKLRYLLKQSNSSNYLKNFTILGWGRNNFGQIGPDINSVATPTKILQPSMTEDDGIKSIHSDKRFSYILTNKGKVFALGGKQLNKIPKNERKLINWEDISKQLVEKGTIIDITTSTSFIGIIYKQEGKKLLKVKMRMAEEIVKLAVCGNISIEQYEVGYLDRFLGMLEIGLQEFLRTEIPKHRIQYFKRNGKIVWDRRSRIDNF